MAKRNVADAKEWNGATGNLDTSYPIVMGKRNGWLGGDGDQWERVQYWVKGLLPLAYILNDKALIVKTKSWVGWKLHENPAAVERAFGMH